MLPRSFAGKPNDRDGATRVYLPTKTTVEADHADRPWPLLHNPCEPGHSQPRSFVRHLLFFGGNVISPRLPRYGREDRAGLFEEIVLLHRIVLRDFLTDVAHGSLLFSEQRR